MNRPPREPATAYTSPAPAEGYAAANKPLIKALTRHADAIAQHCPRAEASGWVFATVLSAWAEDHGLVPTMLRAQAAGRRAQHLTDGGADSTWIRAALGHLAAHRSTACLAKPDYSPLPAWSTPGVEKPLGELLDWWGAEAPDLYNPAPETGPSSITGWLVGDLLQGLSGDRYDGAAFCQTPWFVADFLCEHTLAPAASAFDDPILRVIDPACGTGHILTWSALGLHTYYTAGTPGRPAVDAEASVRRLVAGVCGVELDPLTAAVARLRLTVLYGVLLDPRPGQVKLHEIPSWVRPRVAVANALLAAHGEHELGAVLDDTHLYPGILTPGTYHAVIANPPYKVIGDPQVRDAVRRVYRDVCSGKFPASVPFSKLLFELAIRGTDAGPAGAVGVPEQLALFADGAGAE